MDVLDPALDDFVIFELPTVEAVDAFRVRFRPHWDAWSDAVEHGWLFTARLPANADVAGLLREAQELLEELGVPPIRFYLDGRVYALESPRSPVSRPVDLAATSE
jgi:hypothetical protein